MMIRSVDPLQHTSMYQRAEEGFLFFVVFYQLLINIHTLKTFVDNLIYKTLADSDDSDGEGGLGNVSRVIIRPPGHSGKGTFM